MTTLIMDIHNLEEQCYTVHMNVMQASLSACTVLANAEDYVVISIKLQHALEIVRNCVANLPSEAFLEPS